MHDTGPDSPGKGHVDMAVLMELFAKMPGAGEVDQDDLAFLKLHTDLDGDGEIGFEDGPGKNCPSRYLYAFEPSFIE